MVSLAGTNVNVNGLSKNEPKASSILNLGQSNRTKNDE